MLITCKTTFPSLDHFSDTQESISTRRVPRSRNTHAPRTLAGMGSGKATEAAYFMLLEETDTLLMQAIFNLELHKLVQASSESWLSSVI